MNRLMFRIHIQLTIQTFVVISCGSFVDKVCEKGHWKWTRPLQFDFVFVLRVYWLNWTFCCVRSFRWHFFSRYLFFNCCNRYVTNFFRQMTSAFIWHQGRDLIRWIVLFFYSNNKSMKKWRLLCDQKTRMYYLKWWY